MAMPVKSADLDRWAAEAAAIPPEEVGFNATFDILLDESVEAADNFESYWDPVTEGPRPRPGLSAIAGKGVARTLHAGYGEELLSIHRAASDARSNYAFASKRDASPAPRALESISELDAALGFLFDDGVTDESDERLAALAAERQEATTHPAIASVLDGYANLGELHRADLAALPTFDIRHLDGARDVTEALRRRPATPTAHTPESEEALDTRQRYATLLQRRLNVLRASARYVFRDHPEIASKFTSTYDRRRKRAWARRAAEKRAAQNATAPVNGAPATTPAKPEPVAE